MDQTISSLELQVIILRDGDGNRLTISLQFQKADQELSVLLKQLDIEFAELNGTSLSVNPVSLLNRLEFLRSNLPLLQKEVNEITEEKRQFLQGCQDDLISSFIQLQQLSHATGFDSSLDETSARQFVDTVTEWKSTTSV